MAGGKTKGAASSCITLEGVQLWQLLKNRGTSFGVMKATTKKTTVVNLEVSPEELAVMAVSSQELLKKRMRENGDRVDQVPLLERAVSAELTAALNEIGEDE